MLLPKRSPKSPPEILYPKPPENMGIVIRLSVWALTRAGIPTVRAASSKIIINLGTGKAERGFAAKVRFSGILSKKIPGYTHAILIIAIFAF